MSTDRDRRFYSRVLHHLTAPDTDNTQHAARSWLGSVPSELDNAAAEQRAVDIAADVLRGGNDDFVYALRDDDRTGAINALRRTKDDRLDRHAFTPYDDEPVETVDAGPGVADDGNLGDEPDRDSFDDAETLKEDIATLRDEKAALEATNRDLSQQTSRLAAFIIENVGGEPSRSEGAVDTACRVITELQAQVRELSAAAEKATAAKAPAKKATAAKKP